MGKSSKVGAKEDRKAKKAELNREREKGRRRRQEVKLDNGEVASFAKVLLSEGFELTEVGRDGVRAPHGAQPSRSRARRQRPTCAPALGRIASSARCATSSRATSTSTKSTGKR
jgi:hypothetical protein